MGCSGICGDIKYRSRKKVGRRIGYGLYSSGIRWCKTCGIYLDEEELIDNVFCWCCGWKVRAGRRHIHNEKQQEQLCAVLSKTK